MVIDESKLRVRVVEEVIFQQKSGGRQFFREDTSSSGLPRITPLPPAQHTTFFPSASIPGKVSLSRPAVSECSSGSAHDS